jgi:hypothetical protein
MTSNDIVKSFVQEVKQILKSQGALLTKDVARELEKLSHEAFGFYHEAVKEQDARDERLREELELSSVPADMESQIEAQVAHMADVLREQLTRAYRNGQQQERAEEPVLWLANKNPVWVEDASLKSFEKGVETLRQQVAKSFMI